MLVLLFAELSALLGCEVREVLCLLFGAAAELPAVFAELFALLGCEFREVLCLLFGAAFELPATFAEPCECPFELLLVPVVPAFELPCAPAFDDFAPVDFEPDDFALPALPVLLAPADFELTDSNSCSSP